MPNMPEVCEAKHSKINIRRQDRLHQAEESTRTQINQDHAISIQCAAGDLRKDSEAVISTSTI
jgi:hypothetical protein